MASSFLHPQLISIVEIVFRPIGKAFNRLKLADYLEEEEQEQEELERDVAAFVQAVSTGNVSCYHHHHHICFTALFPGPPG